MAREVASSQLSVQSLVVSCRKVRWPTVKHQNSTLNWELATGNFHRRIATSPLNVFSRNSALPPPFNVPRKLRRLEEDSATGRSLLKLPLKVSNSRSPRAFAGRRSVTPPEKVF